MHMKQGKMNQREKYQAQKRSKDPEKPITVVVEDKEKFLNMKQNYSSFKQKMIKEDLAKDQWFFNLHMKNTLNYIPETETKQINIEEK